MTASIRTRRTLATALSAALVVGGAATVAPAHAATGTVAYACSHPLLGNFTVNTNIDSDLPAPPGKIYAGETRPTQVTAEAVLPAEQAKAAYDFGYRSFAGTIDAQGSIDGTAVTTKANVPSTSLGDQTTATAVPFTATGTLGYLTKAVGTSIFLAGDFVGNLVLTRADGTTTPVTITCTAPRGQAPQIDTVGVVAKSTTALTLEKTKAAYGEAVTAAVKVTTSGGTPAGTVTYVVDGMKSEVKLDKDGLAELVLDQLTLGKHQVSATFVPADAANYESSADGPDTLEVVRAGTKTRLAVTGKRTHKVTRATARVAGKFGTVPTGKVKFVLRKFGDKAYKLVKTKTLVNGKTSAGFGKIGAGVYKVRAVYKGDANHLRSKTVRKFRERRP